MRVHSAQMPLTELSVLHPEQPNQRQRHFLIRPAAERDRPATNLPALRYSRSEWLKLHPAEARNVAHQSTAHWQDQAHVPF